MGIMNRLADSLEAFGYALIELSDKVVTWMPTCPTSGCVREIGHDGPHGDGEGHSWNDAAPYETPRLRQLCGRKVILDDGLHVCVRPKDESHTQCHFMRLDLPPDAAEILAVETLGYEP